MAPPMPDILPACAEQPTAFADCGGDGDAAPAFAGQASLSADALRGACVAGADLLPIPRIPRPPVPTTRSHRVRARYLRAVDVWVVAEAARASINHMSAAVPHAVHDDGEVPPCRVTRAESPQHRVWIHLLKEAKRVSEARRAAAAAGLTGAVLLESLTKRSHADLYGSIHTGPCYLPFKADKMAEPPVHHPVIDLLEALPANVSERYGVFDYVMRPAAEVEAADRKYRGGAYDSILGDRKEYVKYFQRSEAQLLWDLIPEEQALSTLSVAAVANISGTALWKILMCVPFNEKTRSPSEVVGYPVERVARRSGYQPLDLAQRQVCR